MEIPEVDFDSLYLKLKERRFGEIEGSEWKYIILSLIDECEGTSFLGENDEIDFDSVFSLDKKEEPERSERIRIFVESAFGPYERKMLCIATTVIAAEAVRFSDEDHTALLTKLLTLSWHWSCLIDGDLALTMALDRELSSEIRQLALHHLVDRDFRS